LFSLGGILLAQGVKITFRYFPWPDYAVAADKSAKAFDAKYMPQTELVYAGFAGTTDEERAKLMTMFRAGASDFDIVLCDSPWVSEFAAAGWLIPIDQFLPNPASFKGEFYPFSNAIATYNGKQYGITKQIDQSLLYYRTDLLSKAGLQYPGTIEQLVDVAQRVTNPPETWGSLFQGAQYEGLACVWIEFLHNYGGTIFGESRENPTGGVVGHRICKIDSDAGIKATQLLYDLIYKYKVSPPGTTTYTETDVRKLFLSGGAAMMREWQDQGIPLSDPSQSNVVGTWNAGPIPAGPAGSHTCLGGWVWAINKYTKHSKEAWTALKFLTDPEQQRIFLLTDGTQPSRPKVYDDPEVQANAIWGHLGPIFKQVAATGIPRPLSPIWPQQSDVITRAIHMVFTGQMTAGEAMTFAQAQVKKIEDSYGTTH